jgi:hypothetical protein
MSFKGEVDRLLAEAAQPSRVLQVIEDAQTRLSELVVRLFSSTGFADSTELSDKVDSVSGFSVWDIYERVFLAALDIGEDGLVTKCLRALSKRFPKSKKVYRLSLGIYEVQDPEKALQEYGKLRQVDPTDIVSL